MFGLKVHHGTRPAIRLTLWDCAQKSCVRGKHAQGTNVGRNETPWRELIEM